MEDLQDKIIELMDLFDDEVVTTADKIDRPQRALDREAIDDFMKRNPMMDGGMLVKPSADGSRPGYSKEKKLRKNSPITEKERAKNIKAWEKNTGLDFNEHKKNVSRSASSLIELGKTTGIAGGEGTRETRFEEKQKKIKKFLKGKKTIKASVLKDFILNDVGYKKYDSRQVKSLFPNLIIEQDLQKEAERGLKMSKGKLTVANKYAALMHKNDPRDTQYVSSSNYKELPKNEKGKILAIMRANDNKFRVNYSEQLRFPANKEKLIMRDFGLTEEDFFKHGKYGVPTKIDGKVNKKYSRIFRYVDRGFKLPKVGRYSVTDVLTPDQIEFVKNNFELPEGQKEWNFRSPDNPEGYKHGIPPAEYRNLEKQIYTKLKGGSTKYTLAADRSSAKGWMMSAMERLYKNETVLKNGERVLKEGLDKLTYEPIKNEKGIIIGFKDNTAAGGGGTYYGLNKNTPEDATPWTAHGDYDNIQKFLNIANGVKEQPDQVLQKILDEKGITKLLGEKRVLTLNDVLSHERFFDKLSTTRPKVLIERQIVLHHTKGVGDKNLARAAATKDLQLLTGAVNSNVIKLENIVKGAPNRPGRKLTKDEIAQLKNYGAKIVDFDGKVVGGGYLDPDRQFANIEKQALKYAKGDQFNVKTVASYLERLGCGKAAGGRILMSNGGPTLTKCAKRGQLKLENILTKGASNADDAILARTILKAGGGLKSMFALKNIFGPAAIAATVAFEGGLIGYDMLTSGKTLREAFGDNLLNYALGKDYQVDPQEELFKRFKGLGYDNQQIGSIKKALDAMNTINTGAQLAMDVGQQQEALQKSRGQPEEFMIPDDQMMADTAGQRAEQNLKDAKNQLAEFNRDLVRSGQQDELSRYIESGDYAKGFDLFEQAQKAATVEQMQSALPTAFGKVFPKFEERRTQTISENLPFEGVNPAFNIPVDGRTYGEGLGAVTFIPGKTTGGLFGLAEGGRAGYKLGKGVKIKPSKVRSDAKSIIDENIKLMKQMKETGEIDEISSNLNQVIKKALDEDLFDKKDKIVDSINISEAKKRRNYPYNMQVFEEPKNLDFYTAIQESNFKTKTGPFFDRIRRKKAGGGLLKQAGDRSGPPPESGPNPQGLQGLLNSVKKI